MTRVEHWGTFEVANFGDLLYPIVLQHELARLLPAASTTLAGPIGGPMPMGGTQVVRRAVRHDEPGFWSQVGGTDALIVGGGDLLHHGTTTVRVDGALDRIDNWAFAVESGLLGQVRPMVWHGLGVPFDVPADLAPSLTVAAAGVRLLTVRDERSRRRLEGAGIEREMRVVPDTAVLVDRIFSVHDRKATVDRLRSLGRLPETGPLLVAHVSFGGQPVQAEVAEALRSCARSHPDLRIVLLATGPTHDDATTLRAVAERLGTAVWVLDDPTVLEVTSVLGAASVVASTSYHTVLVATVLGVPSLSFAHDDHRPAKTTELAHLLGRQRWSLDRPSDIPAVLPSLLAGEGAVDQRAVAALQQRSLDHFEDVAAVVTSPRPTGVDLRERDAAAGALLKSLARGQLSEARLRREVAILHEHLSASGARSRELELAYWRERNRRSTSGAEDPSRRVLNLDVISAASLETVPYQWALVGPMFEEADSRTLASNFPLDDAQPRSDSDGQRSWSYLVRPLVSMGGLTAVRPHTMHPRWRELVGELAGSDYRAAISSLTGVEVGALDLEVNAFSYPTGGYQDPHPDLPEKVVTHVLWFNEGWRAESGGCLRILNSNDEADCARELIPNVAWSAVFVRSAGSWHCVTPVAEDAPTDRRAVVATFYRPGSVSTMWPPVG